jgi:chemotaxis protein MotB
MSGRSRGAFQDRLNVWPGFTDIMVGLLLVFVFVVTLFTITQTILSQNLSERDTELHRLQKELSLKGTELERLSAEISRLQKLFQTQQAKTSAMDQLLTQKNKELENALADAETKAALVEEKNRALASQSSELEATQKQLQGATTGLEEEKRSLAEQQSETKSAMGRLQKTAGLLAKKEKQVADLGLQLNQTGQDLAKVRTQLSERTASVAELKAKIEKLDQNMATLSDKISSYVAEIDRLNKLVADSKQSEVSEKTKASALQEQIVALRSKLDEISSKLAKARKQADKEFRLSQLVNLLGQKNQEIERLKELAKYRSEFLAKLQQVFSGISDIKVQGDRFVFQSEILFASGRAEINDSGKAELDKFVRIYNEMIPKIPKGLDMIILVQGYTDVDPVRSLRYKSNWELSAARALHVVRYLIEKGIPPTRLGASAFSQFHPAAKGTTPQDKHLDRRIEIKITTI